MGKIKQGILGGFRGKVGTVVGSYWNGIFYMKALPQNYKKGRSGSQKMQHGYFKELVTLAMSCQTRIWNSSTRRSPRA
ncbi:MAG: hypothetical protein II078_00860 [Muribaculaceae bacterium]|nr:hypothetical protein [Muribaculaceae bacterium]